MSTISWKHTEPRWGSIRYFESGDDFVVDATDILTGDAYTIEELADFINGAHFFDAPAITTQGRGYWEDDTYDLAIIGQRIATDEESEQIRKYEAHRAEQNRKARERKKAKAIKDEENALALLARKGYEVKKHD